MPVVHDSSAAVVHLLAALDTPDTSKSKNRDALSDGLAIIRNLTGQDSIPIERKGRDPYSATVTASVWVNTNHPIADWVTGDADRDSWKRRIVPIPSQVQLHQNEQRADYEQRFVSEYPSIAWHCIAAYAEMHHTQAGYSVSPEMLDLRAKQIGGDLPTIQEFTAGHCGFRRTPGPPETAANGLLPARRCSHHFEADRERPLQGGRCPARRGAPAAR